MKFSLKFFFALFLLSSFGVGYYILHREAENGVAIQVHRPIKLDDYLDAPASILEIRSRWQVSNHDNHEAITKSNTQAKTLAKLRRSLKHFYKSSSLRLVESHREEFRKLAQQQLADKDLQTALNSAWILDHFDDETAFPIARKRIIDFYSKAGDEVGNQQFNDFLELFGRKRLAADKEFVEFTRTLTDKPNQLGWASSAFLSYENVDSDPYYRYMMRKATSGRDRSWAFTWLAENQFTPEAKQALVEYLDGGKAPTYSRVIPLIKIENDAADWIPLRNRIERLGHEFLRDPDPKLWEREQERHWPAFCEAATEASVEFFRNAFENLKEHKHHLQVERILYCSQALSRLGHREDASKLLEKLLDAIENRELWAFDKTLLGIFDLAEEFWGREKMIQLCKEHISANTNEGACWKLATLYEGTNNEEMAWLIGKNEDGSLRPQMLSYVEQIGSELLPEFWEGLDSRTQTFRQFKHWQKQNLDRQDLLDWINKELKPDQTITLKTIAALPRPKDRRNYWLTNSPFVHTDHQFSLAALSLSGRGQLFNEHLGCERESLEEAFMRVASFSSPSFTISSAQCDWKTEQGMLHYSLVVNKRLYKFVIEASKFVEEAGGDGYFQVEYPIEAMLEILNSIAIRQRISHRFIYYDGEGLGHNMDLIMLLTPSQVEDLSETFAIYPRPDFEYFLKN